MKGRVFWAWGGDSTPSPPLAAMIIPAKPMRYCQNAMVGRGMARGGLCLFTLGLFQVFYNTRGDLWSLQESPAIADKPRDAKACQNCSNSTCLQLTLSLTILAYLHAFNCYCVRNPRNPEKFTENSNIWSSRSSKVIDIGVNRKPICDLLLVINSNFSCICYRFRDIRG